MASRNLNKVMLIGNLTRDPELRYTPQGNAVASFVVATNREWVSQGERKQSADFHNAVAWNKLAEICSQLLKKGTKVYVEGRLQTRDWMGEDGKKRYKTEIVVDDMILLTSKGASSDGEYGSDDGDSLDTSTDLDSGSDESADVELDLDDVDFDAIMGEEETEQPEASK